MRRILLLAGLLVLCAVSGAAGRTLYWERIDVVVTVNKDSTVNVEEQQEYVFDGDWNGGLRDLALNKLDHVSDIEVWEGDTQYTRVTGTPKVRGQFVLEPLGASRLRIKWRSRKLSDPPY